MNLDGCNALFELGGALLLLLNVRQLLKDKKLLGVRILPTVFYVLWGLWNLKYYSGLNQWWSFVAGISVALVNIAWVILAVYYRRKNK